MVHQCVIRSCRIKWCGNKTIIFHGMPKNLNIVSKWKDVICKYQPDFLPKKHTKLCSRHFVKTDYNSSIVGNKLVLKKGAIPSVFKLERRRTLDNPLSNTNIVKVFEDYKENNLKHLLLNHVEKNVPSWSDNFSELVVSEPDKQIMTEQLSHSMITSPIPKVPDDNDLQQKYICSSKKRLPITVTNHTKFLSEQCTDHDYYQLHLKNTTLKPNSAQPQFFNSLIPELKSANTNSNVETINNLLKSTSELYELLAYVNNIENDIMHSELNIIENNSEKVINLNSENDNCLNEMPLPENGSVNKEDFTEGVFTEEDFTEEDLKIPETEKMLYRTYENIVKINNDKINKYQQIICGYANKIHFLRKLKDDLIKQINPNDNNGYQQLSKVYDVFNFAPEKYHNDHTYCSLF